MFDLHCHILPGIDDGAKSIDEAIELIDIAQKQGIKRMVATPHIHLGIYDNNLKTISKAYSLLLNSLPESNTIQIRTAAEVRICPEIMFFIETQQLPFIGEYESMQVLLLELPSSHIPPGTDNLIKWLISQNVVPMIAHPERNRELQAYPERINPLLKFGSLLQLTAASVLGDFGDKSKCLSKMWLKQKMYDIMASDTHSLNRRPPKLKLAHDKVIELVDHNYASMLVNETPNKISDVLFQE